MIIYTIKQLIKNNVHLGHYKWECDYRLSYFLIGIRNSIHIINIYNSIYILRRILYIIYNIGLLHQKVLLVNNINYKIDTFLHNINKKKLWYVNNKWTGGLLSNQKEIYFSNEKLFKEVYGGGSEGLLPSFVFVSNVEMNNSSIFEAIILNIPNSSLIDSNMGHYGILYKMPSNDENFSIMNLFMRTVAKIYLKSCYDLKKKLLKKNNNKEYIKNKKIKKNNKIIKKKNHKKLKIEKFQIKL